MKITSTRMTSGCYEARVTIPLDGVPAECVCEIYYNQEGFNPFWAFIIRRDGQIICGTEEAYQTKRDVLAAIAKMTKTGLKYHDSIGWCLVAD